MLFRSSHYERWPFVVVMPQVPYNHHHWTDSDIMAMAIRAALDAVPGRLARDPDLDIGRYGRELADLFQAATRPGGSNAGPASHP